MIWEVDTCLICDLLRGETWVPFRTLFSVEEAPSELLFESENFAIIVDVGPIIEGYCLILCKEHVPSLACLSPEQFSELAHMKQKLQTAMQATYGDPVFFEHGAASFSRSAGCCIDHAHLHAVPTKIDILPYLRRIFHFEPLASQQEVRKLARKVGYLFYENQQGQMFLAKENVVPRQYLRRVLSHLQGNAAPWDWRDYIRFAQALETKGKIRRTRSRLAPLLKDA